MARRQRFSRRFSFWLGANVGHLLIGLMGALTRVTMVNDKEVQELFESHQGFILATWHGKMLLPVYKYRNRKIVGMVSTHSDGELIARIIHKLGYETVRGSSTRGGKEAFHGMLELLQSGRVTAIQPDGPTGPIHRVKKGVALLAQRSGCPILPVTFNSTRRKVFGSWDRFTIWLPFSRSVVMFADPIYIPEDISSREAAEMVQQVMMDLENRCETYFESDPAGTN